MSHKGIHHRGYLPHWDFPGATQAITFRLIDSIPGKLIHSWRKDLDLLDREPTSANNPQAEAQLRRLISQYEDAGHGSCLLAKPENASILQNLLLHGHGFSYKLIEWCIMPNHVHLLIKHLDDTPLGEIIKRWKAPSAIQINRIENRTGSLWAADYHDRFIRDLDHLENAIAYIRNNPVKARLCNKPADWPFSSIGRNWTAEFIPPSDPTQAE